MVFEAAAGIKAGHVSGNQVGSVMSLDEGSRIAVVGGGPAGSFFSYFVLQMASRVGVESHG